MRMLPAFQAACLFVLSLFVALPALATTYCVDKVSDLNDPTSPNTTGLINALVLMRTAPEGTVQTLHIKSGDYQLPGDFNLNFPISADNKSVEIEGGYLAGSSGCNFKSDEPTRIFGSPSALAIVSANLSQKIDVSHVTFVGFKKMLVATYCCEASGPVIVRQSAMRNIGSTSIFASGESLLVTQNVFASGGWVEVAAGELKQLSEVSFNTFADIDCAANEKALYLSRNQSVAKAIFHHNIVQGNASCAFDVRVSGAGAWTFRNNLYESEDPTPPAPTMPSGAGNLIGLADPMFVNPAAGIFRLKESPDPVSPAINAGLTIGELGALGLSANAPAVDFEEVPRPFQGGRYDLGAFESLNPSNDGPLLVTDSSDDADDPQPNTLRWAIEQANAVAGPQVIHFDINQPCPVAIDLTDELPTLIDSVDIDGYSQPCASPNDDPLAFNATLGIALTSSVSGGLDHGLEVSSFSSDNIALALRGVSFDGRVANGTAVLLAGGSGHVIQGNRFMGTSALPLRNGIVLNMEGQALIGGAEAGQRNLFGNIKNAGQDAEAIAIEEGNEVVVRNNIIGLADDGGAFRVVNIGIRDDGIDSSITDNVIASARIGIHLDENSQAALFGNTVGLDVEGEANPFVRVGTGILVSGSGARIGGTGFFTRGNTIANTKSAGVHLSDGSGNRIIRNKIYSNGLQDAGLSIDIGPLGPAGNDDFDSDQGPNGGQNSPVIDESSLQPDGKRRITGHLSGKASESYRIDVYRSAGCTANRNAEVWIGSVSNVVPVSQATQALGDFALEIPNSGVGILTATATDSQGSTSEMGECFFESAQLNMAPDIEENQEFSVLVSAAQGDFIGLLLVDDDMQSPLTFAILPGSDSGAFDISSTGAITVKQAGILDVANSPYVLDVQVDDGEYTDTEQVTIHAITENVAPNLENANCTVPVSAGIGTLICGVPYDDDGVPAPVTFAIIAGNGDGIFAVDSQSGVVSVAMANAMQAGDTYTLEVEGSDGEFPDQATLSILVVADFLFSDGFED